VAAAGGYETAGTEAAHSSGLLENTLEKKDFIKIHDV